MKIAVVEAAELEVLRLTFSVGAARLNGIDQRTPMSFHRAAAVEPVKHVVQRGEFLLVMVADAPFSTAPAFIQSPGEDGALADFAFRVGFVAAPRRAQKFEDF